MPYEEMTGMQHRLELDGRERLVVSGVEEVERFDEEEIVMVTPPTENLNHAVLHTLLYEDNAPSASRGGFLRRLLG